MNRLIASQQEILKGLGLYQGVVDGIWGLKSKKAMLGFQQTTGFAGLKPRDGAPFTAFEKMPKGWVLGTDEASIVTADRNKAEKDAELKRQQEEQKRLVEEEQRRLEEEQKRLADELRIKEELKVAAQQQEKEEEIIEEV